MSDSSPSDHNTVSYSTADRIDRCCDEYERELKSGSQPRIEDFVTRIEPPHQNLLLRYLVAIDYEYKQSRNEADFVDYLKRFPDNADELKALQTELDQPPAPPPFHPPAHLTCVETVVGPPISIPQLKDFTFIEVAGTGGFGTVWRAMDLRLKREVAVKIPRSDRTSPESLSGMFREAQVAAKLRHPNIVSVHNVGHENGTSFIVTDYIDGMNLKQWRKTNPLSPVGIARLVAKLAIAVQHAHDQGVIHRDLKLSNVLIDKKGEPYVADFGLAKREARDDSLAIDGQVVGTPAYMAPEQARADHDSIDRRTDVYSLGVILYELVTGVTPFHGDVPQIMQQILDSEPVAPRLIKPNIPRELEAICLKCMAKESSKRYDSAQMLADDLNLFLNGETLRGIPAALPSRVWKWYRRNRRFVLSLGLVAILVATVSTVVVTLRHRGAKPAVPLLPVEFTTEPPGCEITTVAIDPDTGEPDPTKIQKARGKTPLTTRLAGGDYLVVAVLDSRRFHEVFRHVPKPDEVIPWKYVSLKWRRRPSGVICYDSPIKIPRPDISLEMHFCEGTERLPEPASKIDETSTKAWRIPSFFVDREAAVPESNDLKSSEDHLAPAVDRPEALTNYYKATEQLEAAGKRAPSAAELYYLSNVLSPTIPVGDMHRRREASEINQLIESLHSGLWVWTTTKPGGPFSGTTFLSKDLGGIDAMARMTGCGNVNIEQHELPTPTGFKMQKERDAHGGVRGVRSVSPRLAPKDFMSIVGTNSHR